MRSATFAFIVTLSLAAGASAVEPLDVLFLGDRGHHQPHIRAQQLIPALLARGVRVHYTERIEDIETENLARYDALMIYANINAIAPAQEAALLAYVEGGGGLVPIHCASYCFHNSPRYIAMVGAQFVRHGTGVVKTRVDAADHPIMRGYKPFESWDETYEHHKHNATDRTVLEYRDGEPWTWVRTQGKGRVFYTAWGHDHRTWGEAGFADLIERGVRWASGDDNPATTIAKRPLLKPFAFKSQKVPFYPPGQSSRGDGEWNRMQLPVTAEESIKHIVAPAGFDVSLFAAEPQIGKLLAMTWDDRGRLWAIESRDYPNQRQPEGKGRDRILILEDTNADGRADKVKVFADKLSIPTSLCFAGGGLIVHEAPHTLLYKDTDGDDKADSRTVLFTGWGTGDTHAGPSNMVYGHDNWVYGIVGYAGFDGKVGGDELKFGAAFYRFRPDGSKLEYLRANNNNSWGIGVSEEGVLFGSTANNNPSVYLPIPSRYYDRVTGMKAGVLGKIADNVRFLPITTQIRQVDVHGGYTSAAGHALYTARAWPKRYWNTAAFVTDPTGKLAGVFDLTAKGSDFASTNPHNIVSSDDEWFAPIMAEVGPDGQLWIIDFYTFIPQHNPTPAGHKTGPGNAYETPLRDYERGRVYRVSWRDAEPAKPLDLSKASPAQLVAALRHDNLLWRRHAQRKLVERGDRDVVPALVELVNDRSVDAIGLNVGAIHALWTLHGLGSLDGLDKTAQAAAVAAMRHPSAGVRRNAVQVLPPTAESVEAIIAAGLLSDDDAQVRLMTLLALSDMPASSAAGASIYAMIVEPRNANDRWIPDAATIAAAMHHAGFLSAANTGAATPVSPDEHKPVGPNLIPNPSFEDAAAGKPVGWSVRTYAGPATHAVVEGGRTGRHALRIESGEGSDTSWFATVPVKPSTRYRLSGWIKTDNVAQVANGLGALLNVHELQQPRIATPAVIGSSDWKRVEIDFDNHNRTQVTINCLFGGWGQARGVALYDDLELVEVGPAQGGPAGVADHPSRIVQIVAKHAATVGAGGPIRHEADAAELLKGGDAERGKTIFFKNEIAGCFRCHKVGAEGGIIGPDLTGIAAKKDRAYLLESLIDPNATIAENYPAPVSPMPPMRLILNDQEIRDLVEYLTTLK